MAKIVLIGAGSYVFSRDIITEILQYPNLSSSDVVLVDIDKERLDIMTALTKKIVQQQGLKTKISSAVDRKEVLEGANYVITAIRAGGWTPVLANRQAALKHGLEACPDQLGTGGVFGALRQIPAILDICHDMEKLCPNALLINYSNPMAMICWAINDYSHIKSVGLCPNAHGGATRLARYAGAPFEDCSYWAAGINHFTWYLDFRVRGEDAYPLFRNKFKDYDEYSKPGFLGKYGDVDLVEVEMMKNFGYFTSGSQAHLSMYLPYFRRKPVLAEKYRLDDYGPIFGGAPKKTADETEELKQQLAGDYKFPFIDEYRWSKHAADVMDSMETGKIRRIDGNVKNKGLITNLLEGCTVEVPCLVDKEGIHPCFVGDLPPQCATLNRTNIGEQELAVRGIVEKDKKKIFQSLLIDPLASSLMTIDECRDMVDEMFKIDKPFLKGFK